MVCIGNYHYLSGMGCNKEQAELLGGSDLSDYVTGEKRGCDKFHHLMSSIAHQPNHLKYLNKLKRKEKEVCQQEFIQEPKNRKRI